MINKKSIFITTLIIAIVISIYFYLQHRAMFPQTDNAYLQANIVHVAPEVSGKVEALLVSNNQKVTAGDPIMIIDAQKYDLALTTASANLELAIQQHEADKESVIVAKAILTEKKAQLELAKKTSDRLQGLIAAKLIPANRGDEVAAQYKMAKAAYLASEQQLLQAQQKLGHLDKENAAIKKAQAAIKQAELDLKHTKIIAATSGVISNLNVRPGDLVHINQALFAIINHDVWWANANFKETQIKRIKAGQPAEISVDIYPDAKITGTVDSISDGSGSTFSLLPAENASGNWVKVTQRFQVKVLIHINEQTPDLRVGASANVTIDTSNQ